MKNEKLKKERKNHGNQHDSPKGKNDGEKGVDTSEELKNNWPFCVKFCFALVLLEL